MPGCLMALAGHKKLVESASEPKRQRTTQVLEVQEHLHRNSAVGYVK